MKQFFNILAIGVLILAIILFGDSQIDDDRETPLSSKDGGILVFSIKADRPLKVERRLQSEKFITISQTSRNEKNIEITVAIKRIADSYMETIKFEQYMELNIVNNYMRVGRYYISMYGQFGDNLQWYGFSDQYHTHPLVIGELDANNKARVEFLNLHPRGQIK